MQNTEMTWHQKVNLMNHIGDAYRGSLRRIDLAEKHGAAYSSGAIADDYALRTYVERALKDCSSQTRLITTRDFLEVNDPHWYRLYFSQSSYYRARRKAVDEYLHNLDLC